MLLYLYFYIHRYLNNATDKIDVFLICQENIMGYNLLQIPKLNRFGSSKLSGLMMVTSLLKSPL